MARGKKTGGRDFVKGVSGNPNGAPALPPEVKAFKKLTKENVEEIASVILAANEQAIYNIVHDTESTVLQKWLASAALNGIQIGDIDQLDKILNRIIGKPKDSDAQIIDPLDGMSDSEKISALEKALEFMKSKQVTNG